MALKKKKIKTAGVGVFFSFVSVADILSGTQKTLPKLAAFSLLYSTPSRYLANKVVTQRNINAAKSF